MPYARLIILNSLLHEIAREERGMLCALTLLYERAHLAHS
jgi:hypothetical protein